MREPSAESNPIAEAASPIASTPPVGAGAVAQHTVYRVIIAISVCHLLNDMMQSLLPAIYPNLKADFGLSFGQIGLVTLVYQVTASIAAADGGAVCGPSTDAAGAARRHVVLAAGLLVLSRAHSYGVLLVGASLLGVGSSVFHPESSRVARMAAGRVMVSRSRCSRSAATSARRSGRSPRRWWWCAGDNRASRSSRCCRCCRSRSCGTSGLWYAITVWRACARRRTMRALARRCRSGSEVKRGMTVLLVLMFSKYVYLASLTSYFTFYLIQRFALSVSDAQLQLFVFLAAVAVGTVLGGPIGDSHRPPARHLVLDPRALRRSRCCCRTRVCSGPDRWWRRSA